MGTRKKKNTANVSFRTRESHHDGGDGDGQHGQDPGLSAVRLPSTQALKLIFAHMYPKPLPQRSSR